MKLLPYDKPILRLVCLALIDDMPIRSWWISKVGHGVTPELKQSRARKRRKWFRKPVRFPRYPHGIKPDHRQTIPAWFVRTPDPLPSYILSNDTQGAPLDRSFDMNPCRACLSPNNTEFNEEFFMIPSWADHVTELQCHRRRGHRDVLKPWARHITLTTGRLNHGTEDGFRKSNAKRTYGRRREWTCDSAPSCKRAVLHEILRSLRRPARERVVLRFE